MYHLKFSLRAGSAGGASDGGSPDGGTPPSGTTSAAVCSNSSAIMFSFPASVAGPHLLLQSAKLAQQLMQAKIEDPVNHKEEQPEEEDGDKHDRRRGFHFLARGGDHLAHLAAHVGEKVSELLP